MNIALLVGRKGSKGVPKKNIKLYLNRPSAEYPCIAFKHSSKVDKLYVSTDCPIILEISTSYGATPIKRPDSLSTDSAINEDVYLHAYNEILKNCSLGERINTISLLHCNVPQVNPKVLDEAIDFLSSSNKEFDSCVSVTKLDMFSPIRARKLTGNGEVLPFLNELDYKDIFESANSSRESIGHTYFQELSIQVIKPYCLERMDIGMLPFRYLGRKIKGIELGFGFDVDMLWQAEYIESILLKLGYTEKNIPW